MKRKKNPLEESIVEQYLIMDIDAREHAKMRRWKERVELRLGIFSKGKDPRPYIKCAINKASRCYWPLANIVSVLTGLNRAELEKIINGSRLLTDMISSLESDRKRYLEQDMNIACRAGIGKLVKGYVKKKIVKKYEYEYIENQRTGKIEPVELLKEKTVTCETVGPDLRAILTLGPRFAPEIFDDSVKSLKEVIYTDNFSIQSGSGNRDDDDIQDVDLFSIE